MRKSYCLLLFLLVILTSCLEYFNSLLDLSLADGAIGENLGTPKAGDIVSAGEKHYVFVRAAADNASIYEGGYFNGVLVATVVATR